MVDSSFHNPYFDYTCSNSIDLQNNNCVLLFFIIEGQGNGQLRKEEEQDTVCEVWPPELPSAEEPLLGVRLSGCSRQEL